MKIRKKSNNTENQTDYKEPSELFGVGFKQLQLLFIVKSLSPHKQQATNLVSQSKTNPIFLKLSAITKVSPSTQLVVKLTFALTSTT